jgi:hypothetical protein
MDNRTLSYLTYIVIIGFVVLIAMNILPFLQMQQQPINEKYLSYNGVRGMAIAHRQKLYTLNFDQQNEMIGFLNASIPTAKTALGSNNQKPDFDKIVIYRFNASDIELVPVAYQDGSLIFSAPEWNPDGYMKDEKGAIKSLSESAYD